MIVNKDEIAGSDEVEAQVRNPALIKRSQINPLVAASQFLKKPILSTIERIIVHFFSQAAFFSEKRRKKFERSAAKRDYRWLSEALQNLSETSNPSDGSEFTPPFNGLIQKKRIEAASNPWKALLHGAQYDTNLENLPAITLSVVMHNSQEWLDGLLASILNQNYPLSKLNLSFIDGGSTDKTRKIIEEFQVNNLDKFSSISLNIQDEADNGFGHSISFRKSSDDFVFVCNVALRFHEGSLVDAVKIALVDLELVASWELRRCPYEDPKYYDPVSLETSWSSHICTLVRRSAYDNVGGYDDKVFIYSGDIDLSFRFRRAGYKIRYIPQVTVTYYGDFEEYRVWSNQFTASAAVHSQLPYRYRKVEASISEYSSLEGIDLNKMDNKRLLELIRIRDSVDHNQKCLQNAKEAEVKEVLQTISVDFDISRNGLSVPLQSDDQLVEPLVSIVTRTHGSNTQLLAEAVISVCNQTYGNIEHIIVEDRTDYAKELIEGMQSLYKSNLRYVKSDGQGRAAAGNTGLAHATGKFMMFLDSDDLLFADHVEILVRALIENDQAPAAYALSWEVPTFYDQNGRYREDAPRSVESQATPFSVRKLRKGNFIPIQCVLFRRNLYDTFGGFDLEIDHLEDWNLWCRYSIVGDFYYVAKTTSMYRVPGDPGFRLMRSRAMISAEKAVRERNELQFENRV